MKTWQSFLAHIGITAAQAALAVPFFDNNKKSGALANVGVQLGAQFGLTLLQALVAQHNSNTDPNGKQLVETTPGTFVTEPGPVLVSTTATAGGK